MGRHSKPEGVIPPEVEVFREIFDSLGFDTTIHVVGGDDVQTKQYDTQYIGRHRGASEVKESEDLADGDAIPNDVCCCDIHGCACDWYGRDTSGEDATYVEEPRFDSYLVSENHLAYVVYLPWVNPESVGLVAENTPGATLLHVSGQVQHPADSLVNLFSPEDMLFQGGALCYELTLVEAPDIKEHEVSAILEGGVLLIEITRGATSTAGSSFSVAVN